MRRTLFVQPLAIIFLSFLGIFAAFNLAMTYFMTEQADEAIDDQFELFDKLYQGQSTSNQAGGGQSIFSTIYVITDSSGQVQYSSTSQDAFMDDDVTDDLTSQVYASSDSWGPTGNTPPNQDFDGPQNLDTNNPPQTIERGDDTYAVSMQAYHGQLQGYYVQSTTDNAQDYYVFVFINISPMERFTQTVNGVLGLLIVLVALAASLSIYLTSRKLTSSFDRLKGFITRLGKRQGAENLEPFPYQEFTEVGQTVQEMDQMIQQNQKSQRIFFENASHELRTPLMSIQGYAEGIATGVLADQKDAASVILSESQKMTHLVDDILTLSRLETIQDALKLEPMVLSDTLYDLTWRLHQQAEELGITFVHDFPDQRLTIQADDLLLSRAVTNLLTNALRYAKSQIGVATRTEGDWAVITISNDGPQIPDQDLPHIFERFYKGQAGNFGIGLAMTADIVKRHGGRIEVSSSTEETTFTIFLPRDKS